jgi:hypothetical protein
MNEKNDYLQKFSVHFLQLFKQANLLLEQQLGSIYTILLLLSLFWTYIHRLLNNVLLRLKKPLRFEAWIFFRLQVKRRETPILLYPVDRVIPDLWTDRDRWRVAQSTGR